MKHALLSLLVLFQSAVSFADAFPTSPVTEVTPGDLCQHADEIRYPERIVYCKRHVSSQLKNQIIDYYDREFGFEIRKTGRDRFKIDHYIPLCMGGSNERANLWPQHESVYTQTDPLEEAACKKMAEGKLKQAEAIKLIVQAKGNPSTSPQILTKILKY